MCGYSIVLYSLFALLTRRKAADDEAAFGDSELLLSVFFLILYDCNLELLVDLPSRKNYCKMPFPSAQQHDNGWI